MREDESGLGPDALDERLDRALRSYAEPAEVPEPRLVMAQLMARAREAESRRGGWWIWAVSAACTAVTGLAVVLLLMHGPQRAEIAGVSKTSEAVKNLPLPKAAGRDAVDSIFLRPTRRVNRMESRESSQRARTADLQSAAWQELPKLDVFPTPRPLSPDEQALVEFVRQAPPAAKDAVIDDQQHWDDPIIVADLRKPPLESSSQQNQ